MPAERLECDGEPTFSAELRQVGDGLLVRRPQRPPESGLGFSGGQVARSGRDTQRGSTLDGLPACMRQTILPWSNRDSTVRTGHGIIRSIAKFFDRLIGAEAAWAGLDNIASANEKRQLQRVT